MFSTYTTPPQEWAAVSTTAKAAGCARWSDHEGEAGRAVHPLNTSAYEGLNAGSASFPLRCRSQQIRQRAAPGGFDATTVGARRNVALKVGRQFQR